MSTENESPAALTPEGVDRREWLKNAMTAGVVVSGVAAFSRADAKQASTPPPAPAPSATPTAPAAAAELVQTTLLIDGLPAGLAGPIDVLSWKHGFTVPPSPNGDDGPPKEKKHGRCDHADLTISKYLDRASPTFNQWASAATPIPKAVVTISQSAKADGAPVRFYTLDLEDVLITSRKVKSGHPAELPIETLTLHYNKIKWTYQVQGVKGNQSVGWDLEKNQAA